MNLDDQLLLTLDKPVDDENFFSIQELLKKGANANAVSTSGNRPIHLAILRSPRNSKLVKELIKYGALVNVVNKYGTTPLAFSMRKECHKTSRILVEKHAELNFQCQRGWTSLMLASMNGDENSVKILLQHGANANKCDKDKRTALMFACQGNYSKVIKVLLEYGADPGMRDELSLTAMLYYLKKSYPSLDLVNRLLLHCACFLDLTISVEASCRKLLKLCMRGSPPYHHSVKTVVKVMVLFECDRNYLLDYGDLFTFSSSCQAECRYMNTFRVSTMKSVAGLLEKCLHGYFPIESELQGLLPFVANTNFPLYKDFLRALIRKSFLRKKFLRLCMYAKREGQEDVILVPHVNSLIMCYLSDEDITNFVLSAYVNLGVNYLEHQRDFTLYPPGVKVNVNDLVPR